jgi:hypothetical protein
MLVACRLAGLSALGAHYADVNAPAQMPGRAARATATVILRLVEIEERANRA